MAWALGENAKQASRKGMKSSGVIVLSLIDAFMMAASLEKISPVSQARNDMGIAVGDRRYRFFAAG
jgi:hypothetical protein